MNIRDRIESIFSGKAFDRPLFYNYSQGLRFELSEGGTSIEQFLQAINKATEICRDIFSGDEILVCLRSHHSKNYAYFAYRKEIDTIYQLGIKIPSQRCLWMEEIPVADRWNAQDKEWWINLAFYVSSSQLQNILWSPLAQDFTSILPQLRCLVYLFDLDRGLIVFPYDDRGMDVVGNDLNFLARLYQKYNHYLLGYDREKMDRHFQGTY